MGQIHRDARARRVVTGVDEQGRSTFISDELTETRRVTDAFTLNHLWQATSVPMHVTAENALGKEAVIPPPTAGFTYMVTTMPPDHEWDYEAGYAKALSDSHAGDSFVDGEIPGLHATDTVDIITIISGEVWAVTETGEKLLKPRDTIVQRGTKHAWRNRGDVPCEMVVIHFGAVR